MKLIIKRNNLKARRELENELSESELAVRYLLDKTFRIVNDYAGKNKHVSPEVVFSAMITLSDINSMKKRFNGKISGNYIKRFFHYSYSNSFCLHLASIDLNN